MNRLSRIFFTTLILSLISLVIFAICASIQDPGIFHLSGVSPVQALIFVGLTLFAGFLVGAFIVSGRNPAWSEKIIRALGHQMEKPRLRTAILSAAVAMILVASTPLWYLLVVGGERFGAILLNSLPLIFLAIALPLQVIGLEFFKTDRKGWVAILSVSSLCVVAGILLQSSLLNHPEYPIITYGMKERMVAQVLSVLVILAFVIHLSKLPNRERLFWILIVALVTVFFLLQWMTFTRKLWRMQYDTALYAVFLIFGVTLLTKFIIGAWNWLVIKTQGRVNGIAKIAASVVLVFLAYFYYQAAIKHMNTVNRKMDLGDQASYIEFVKEVRNSNFKSTGDHNRMPLYPYLQAAFYRSDMSDKQLFKQAKQLNIILSMVFLGLLFLIFLKSFRFYQAFLLIIIIAYSLYIFKAPYMQAEILFFSIAAISFILMLRILIRPTWWLAIVTGIMVGLAYLTKGTVLPSLFLFAALYGAKQAISMVREVRNAGLSNLRTVAIQFGYLIILLVFFTVTVYPYLRAMKLRFGHYFYNVNTTVYIWYDSYDQAIEEEAKYHFTEGWPEQLPEDQIPGIGKYLSDHTLQQIIGRFMTGFVMQLNNIYSQYSVTNYPISYLIIFLLAILIDVRNGFRTARNNPYLVLFTILYFFGYLVAFSWYAPIAGGRRFFFGLYIPLLIVVFASINELAKNQPAAYGEKAPKINLARFFSTSNVIIALTLIYNIWLILTRVLFYSRFGS